MAFFFFSFPGPALFVREGLGGGGCICRMKGVIMVPPPPLAGSLCPPTGATDVMCQTKNCIYRESGDEIRGPEAALSPAIRGEEERNPANFASPSPPPHPPFVLQACCSVSPAQICVMTSEGDAGLATQAHRRPDRKLNCWLSQVYCIANFHVLPVQL